MEKDTFWNWQTSFLRKKQVCHRRLRLRYSKVVGDKYIDDTTDNSNVLNQNYGCHKTGFSICCLHNNGNLEYRFWLIKDDQKHYS